jgi:hypothetical protein
VNEANDDQRIVSMHVVVQPGERGETIRAMLHGNPQCEQLLATCGAHLLLLAESIDTAFSSRLAMHGKARIELTVTTGIPTEVRVGWLTDAEIDALPDEPKDEPS